MLSTLEDRGSGRWTPLSHSLSLPQTVFFTRSAWECAFRRVILKSAKMPKWRAQRLSRIYMNRPRARSMWWRSSCSVSWSVLCSSQAVFVNSLGTAGSNALPCVSGAAESGKSTLLKQIRILYSHGFSKAELVSFKVMTVTQRGACHQAVEPIKEWI